MAGVVTYTGLSSARMLDERNTTMYCRTACYAATELRIMALIDDGGASRGCYGPSLVPVLPQAPGGAQRPGVLSTPQSPPTLRPWYGLEACPLLKSDLSSLDFRTPYLPSSSLCPSPLRAYLVSTASAMSQMVKWPKN